MRFAENVKQMRQRLFFSQEAFAKELNVNLTTVSRWETGKSKPNMSTMRQIDIVNIGLHFFLKDVRPMLPPVMNHSIAVA